MEQMYDKIVLKIEELTIIFRGPAGISGIDYTTGMSIFAVYDGDVRFPFFKSFFISGSVSRHPVE